ncbi:hypothetical protein P59_086 [Bacillus phage P59]|nr:hypothetical protein P59_086 [Bacillus phage P59]
MSVTFTERKALEKYIEYIVEERTRLLEEYKSAMSRLSKLDDIDNVHPEITEKVEQSAPALSPAKQIIPEMVPAQPGPINSLEEAIEALQAINGVPDSEDKYVYDRQKEIIKDIDRKNSPVKSKSTQRDIKKITQEVVNILKDAGRPVKTRDIIKKLEEKGHKVSSPYGMINQVKGYEPKIQQVSHGYYQYKW